MRAKDDEKELVEQVAARRYKNGILEDQAIAVAREVPYTLFVNDREILSIASLPCHLEDLFIGFLVSEGVVVSVEETVDCHVDHANKIVIVEVDVPTERIDKVERKGMLTSGCAGGMVFSVETAASGTSVGLGTLKVHCSSIIERMHELDTHKGVYRATKGVHGASVATPTEMLEIREDLGRHNAVDKIVGHCFRNRIPTSDKLLLTTGRITSEVLSKAARGGFPIIVSRSSASAMAAQIAAQCSIDVASYVRGRRFNYFSHGGVKLITG